MDNVLHLHHLHILGNSKIIIECLQRKSKLHATKIEGWKRRARDLHKNFQGTYYQHIYMESNEEVDRISKRALEAPKGILFFFTWINGIEGPQQNIYLFWKKKMEKKRVIESLLE